MAEQVFITGVGVTLEGRFHPGAAGPGVLITHPHPLYGGSLDNNVVWTARRAFEARGWSVLAFNFRGVGRSTGAYGGGLKEGASGLFADKAPPDTDATRDAGLRYAIRMLNGYGITGIQDASVNEEDLKTYRRLDDAGELSLHVVASIWWERDQGLEQVEEIKRLRGEYTKRRVDASTVKIMQDGVMENYTAVVLEPYKLKGKKDVRGIPMVEPELLKKVVTQLDADGFQVHFHAIGDGAVRQSRDAVAAARATPEMIGSDDVSLGMPIPGSNTPEMIVSDDVSLGMPVPGSNTPEMIVSGNSISMIRNSPN